jgi:hypothetical protein
MTDAINGNLKTLADFADIADSDLSKLYQTIPLYPNEMDPLLKQLYEFCHKKNRYNRPHLLSNLIGVVALACVTQRTTEFLLSRSIMTKLLAQDRNVNRKTISGDELDVFFSSAKENGLLKELEAPSKVGGSEAKAGMYQILLADVINYVERGTLDALIFERLSVSDAQGEAKIKESAKPEVNAVESVTPKIEPEKQEAKPEEPKVTVNQPEAVNSDDTSDPTSPNYIYKEGDEYKPACDVRSKVAEAEVQFLEVAKALTFDYQNAEEFGQGLRKLARQYTVEVSNAWGDFCDSIPPSQDVIKEAIEYHLAKRFKKNDSDPRFGFHGEIASRLRTSLFKLVNSGLSRGVTVRIRKCTPLEWKAHCKVEEIISQRAAVSDPELGELFADSPLMSRAYESYTDEEFQMYQKVNEVQKQDLAQWASQVA